MKMMMMMMMMITIIQKVVIIVTQSICNIRYKTLNEIPIVLHNKSNYHNHFITRELAEES